MIRALLPAVILGGPVLAEENCVWVEGSSESCVHVIGCIEKPRHWTNDLSFHGRAIGWDSGTVALDVSDGQTCVGTWKVSDDVGVTGQIACSGSLAMTIESLTPIDDEILGMAGSDNQSRSVRGWVGRFGDLETLAAETTFARITNMRTCYIAGYGLQRPDKR